MDRPDDGSQKTIRILMVVRLFHPWIGGTEIQSYRLAKKLSQKNIDVQIVTGWWFRGTEHYECFDQIPVFRNHTLWGFFDIKGLRKFGGYLYILSLLWYLWRKRKDYDIIHVQGFSYHTFAAALIGKWFGHKTITKVANSGLDSDIRKMRDDYELALSSFMLPTSLTCDRFIAVNRKVVEELTNAGVPPIKIIELSNGIDSEQFQGKDGYALNSPARIIFVGRLHEQKDLNTLLMAFHELHQSYSNGDLCLQFVGEGPQCTELDHTAKRLGIAKQIEFFGQSDQVADLLRQADIFVLPSRAEGLSNSLLEAMACGLPVVVSNIAGNIDVIDHEENGLLFLVGDSTSLAQQIASLLQSRELRERLGHAARQTIERRYSLEKIADQYISLYKGLLDEGKNMQGAPGEVENNAFRYHSSTQRR